jgi:hypothetical protein
MRDRHGPKNQICYAKKKWGNKIMKRSLKLLIFVLLMVFMASHANAETIDLPKTGPVRDLLTTETARLRTT